MPTRTFLLVALLVGGCDARFIDLRPESERPGAPDGVDAGPPAREDGGIDDVDGGGGTVDAGGGEDASPPADGGSPPEDTGTGEEVLAVGSLEGRGGYDAAGTVTLSRTADGYVLELGDDFDSAGVPGPVVVVTPRDALGTSLTGEDLKVASLEVTSGAMRFELASIPDDPAYVFIYCEPFGVETARAAMEAP